jgi:hypothetical protein
MHDERLPAASAAPSLKPVLSAVRQIPTSSPEDEQQEEAVRQHGPYIEKMNSEMWQIAREPDVAGM